MNFIMGQIKRNIRIIHEIIHEIFLDGFMLVAAQHHEIIKSIMGIDFHDVPEYGLAADLHHGLGANACLFAKARTEPTCQNRNFHCPSPDTQHLLYAFFCIEISCMTISTEIPAIHRQ